MVTRLERRGMTRPDAQAVVSKMAQYENVFVNLMVIEDLGLQISDEDENLFLLDAFVMFISFACVGLLPVAVLLIGSASKLPSFEIFGLSITLALVLLGVLGMIKSSFSSSSSLYSVVEAVVLGAICTAVAFGLGFFIRSISI